jgi:threonine synthase
VSVEERCVLYNCATGLKYPMPPSEQGLDRFSTIDYGAMT